MIRKPLSLPQMGSSFSIYTAVFLGFPWFMHLMERVFPFPPSSGSLFPLLGVCLLTLQGTLQIGLSQLWRLRITPDSVEWGCLLWPKRLDLSEIETAYESGDILRGFILLTPQGQKRIVCFLDSEEVTAVRLALADKLRESPPVQGNPCLKWGAYWPFIVLPLFALNWVTLFFEMAVQAAFQISRPEAKAILFDAPFGHEQLLFYPLIIGILSYSWVWIESGELRLRKPLQFLTRSKRAKAGRIALSEVESIESKEELSPEGFRVIKSMSIYAEGEEITLSPTAPNFSFVTRELLNLPQINPVNKGVPHSREPAP